MKKDNLDIATVRALHQAREFSQAESGYLSLLRKNPQDIDTLHALSILYAQQDNLSDAMIYLKKAIDYQPNNSTLQLHLANLLKAQGRFDEAVSVLKNTLANHPNYAAAYNNLGTLFYAQGKFNEAIAAYQNAIHHHPEFIDAFYNLGLAQRKNHQLDEAIVTYQTLLRLSPEHDAARFHLASIYVEKEQIDEALKEFIHIEKRAPHHFETQSNMAACYLKKGALKTAKQHYLNALELLPDDIEILFNLGVIETQLGNLDRAIQHYQKALQINPDFYSAHNNLAVAFLTKQHVGFALEHFKEAKRLQPDNASLDYTIQALSQNQRLMAAPTDYIKSLFDGYADHYDQHLLIALEYQIPDHFSRILKQQKLAPASSNILDLGCGTGLCSEAIKPFAKQLTGVDLSENMLALAREKNQYDVLACEDFNVFLSNHPHQYDLIIAGDALVYIGNLAPLFQLIQEALTPNGLFLFNAEISENEEYKMNQSGRFSHHKNSIETLAKKNHFQIIDYERITTRMQNNEPVQGHLFLIRKKQPKAA